MQNVVGYDDAQTVNSHSVDAPALRGYTVDDMHEIIYIYIYI